MKRFLKYFGGLLIVGLLFIGKTRASAAVMYDEDILSKSRDLEEVKAIEYTIISEAKKACTINAIGTSNAEDIIIDYDNAVRVYTDYRFFTGEEVSEQYVEQITGKCIESWSYVWQVPVSSRSTGKVVGVVVARQPKLNSSVNFSEEEKKIISEKAGKYTATDAVVITDERKLLMSYVKDIEASIPEGSKVRLFGTQPGFFQPVGAVISDGKISGIFSLGYYYSIQEHINEEFSNGKIYDYATLYPTIADITANNIEAAMNGLSTQPAGIEVVYKESSPLLWIVLSLLALVIIVLLIMTIIKLKSKRR